MLLLSKHTDALGLDANAASMHLRCFLGVLLMGEKTQCHNYLIKNIKYLFIISPKGPTKINMTIIHFY